jgi:hypothetical protein
MAFFHIGARALAHLCKLCCCLLAPLLLPRTPRTAGPPEGNSGARSLAARARSGSPSLMGLVEAPRARSEDGSRGACMASDVG